MDLNALYSDHQIALIRAADPSTSGDRNRYRAIANSIADRIRALQDACGVRATALIQAAAL